MALPAVSAPEDLSEPAKALWDRLMPHAVAQRTLTEAEAFGFGELCENIVLKRLMLVEILADGLQQTDVQLQMDESGGGVQSVRKKPHALLANYRGMLQRVEAGLARFKLTGMGKEVVVAPQEEDPFAQFEKAAG